MRLPSNCHRLFYGNGVFVGHGYNTDKGSYSTDHGRTWQAMSLGKSLFWGYGAYGKAKYIVPSGKSRDFAYSSI